LPGTVDVTFIQHSDKLLAWRAVAIAFVLSSCAFVVRSVSERHSCCPPCWIIDLYSSPEFGNVLSLSTLIKCKISHRKYRRARGIIAGRKLEELVACFSFVIY
jgi:hypothetical protein